MVSTSLSSRMLVLCLALTFAAVAAEFSYSEVLDALVANVKIVEDDDNEVLQGESPTVTLQYGTAYGNGGTVNSFYGIPYAVAPTDGLRFKSPIPWWAHYPKGELDASTPPPACLQNRDKTFPIVEPQSEDCLYLNVFTPHFANPKSALPVMFFIHGGAFEFGKGDSNLYDGSYLAEKYNVVVVNFEYRLGPFGYLALPELAAEAGGGVGNYGFQDQQAALKFVKENIGAFGGSSDDIMIFGESAGAISVCLHLVSPESKGLFKGALMESGFCSLHQPAHAYSIGEELVSSVGCSKASDKLACMRSASTSSILAFTPKKPLIPSLSSSFTWWPVEDKVTFMDEPFYSFGNGTFNSVPVVAGSNADEGSLFAYTLFSKSVNILDYVATCFSLCKSFKYTFQALEMYPPHLFKDNRDQITQVITDYIFACPTRRLMHLITAKQDKGFLYRFNVTPDCPAKQGYGPDPGVYHGSELTYVFGTGPSQNCTYNSKDVAVEDLMQTYWTNFAQNADVNQGTPTNFQWPSYDINSDTNIEFNIDGPTTQTNLLKKQCDLWDQVNPEMHDDGKAAEKLDLRSWEQLTFSEQSTLKQILKEATGIDVDHHNVE
eukprot:GFYU01004013.1.p1 GENE.GFYU01004013.1~~GFYU01004013.1.p1  ORF type:complete len:621 (-),score=197.36 GFYU01004013.1:246-2057(-)